MSRSILQKVLAAAFFLTGTMAFGSEADLNVPKFVDSPGYYYLLLAGIGVCIFGIAFGLYGYNKIRKMTVHDSMKDIGELIFQTCKSYLLQQGKLLAVLEIFIALCIIFYFGFLKEIPMLEVIVILLFSVIGILGSYGVAWFGIRVNTFANARTAFASLKGKPLEVLNIPLKAGMSIGVILVSVELAMMLMILLFVPGNIAGYCFIGFAIGESLGASALRVAGGIFTKIADIGSDLMKIFIKMEEDDPRNPGVIADCTGDNAGDSVGPTADGFETYGVTGVALISFILLAVPKPEIQIMLLVWIFVMRYLMIATSIISYWINEFITDRKYENSDVMDFEAPLTSLIWITSILSIIMTFIVSNLMLSSLGNIWIVLAVIISCGTIGAALIPEFTKIFTSTKAKHTKEIVTAAKEGEAPLTVLSGIVAGNFSSFWIGLLMIMLMFVAHIVSGYIPADMMIYANVFAFGLVAFGFLGMGPVTIAVDSYGPVTDNAQSVYELSQIEKIKGIEHDLDRNYGFKPDFKKAKELLEENDGAGNTFKATAKPVLIGTAVVGATTMIFSLILLIKETLNIQPESILNLLNSYTILGLMAGGAVIFWFSGASMQAVTTGAFKAVEFIKQNIKVDEKESTRASIEHSKEVVKICTEYAQKGMFNIFVALFSFALAFAFFSSPAFDINAVSFFISYLISIAIFGLFQAIYMANAGGAWDNAKKIVECELKAKGQPIHAATIVGDTVGDPFKDTSSVAMNPIIKFTTLFGLLAMEIAITEKFRAVAPYVGVVFLIIALYFVWRSFYKMRIPEVI